MSFKLCSSVHELTSKYGWVGGGGGSERETLGLITNQKDETRETIEKREIRFV